MVDPVLPQTSTQGGPNPNSTNVGLSVLDLPSFGGTVNGALTGGARAAAMANLQAQQQQALLPAQSQGLPSFEPGAAPLTDPTSSAAGNAFSGLAQGNRLGSLVQQTMPGVPEAIHNWMFNPVGGADATAYQARNKASSLYGSPEAQTYFGAHPSLLAHAEADPVGFAQKLGPILEAAAGPKTPGQVVHNTPDGPMLKNDDHTKMTDAVAKSFGITQQQGHAITQPHQYTRAEYIAAMRGVPVGSLKNAFEMQRYLTPDQQGTAAYLASIFADKDAAKQGQLPSPAQLQLEQNLRGLTYKNPYIQ